MGLALGIYDIAFIAILKYRLKLAYLLKEDIYSAKAPAIIFRQMLRLLRYLKPLDMLFPVLSADDFDVDVKCDTNEINVVLHIKSPLHHDPESVHLNDVSCKPYFQNDSHIFIKSTLDACGMTWNLSADGEMIVYSNAITALVRTQKTLGLHATRDHQAVFEFQCRYKRKAVLSVVSFDPSKIFVVTDIG